MPTPVSLLKEIKVVLLVSVDDIIIEASSEALLKEVQQHLSIKFDMKDLGKLSSFLGIKFERNDSSVVMSQKHYLENILKSVSSFINISFI